MSEPTHDHVDPEENRWVNLWRRLWKAIYLLWSLFICGIIDSIIAARLTSDKNFPVISPVGRAMQNLPFTLSLGASLIFFTLLVWVLSHQHPSQHALLPSDKDHLALIRTLRQE